MKTNVSSDIQHSSPPPENKALILFQLITYTIAITSFILAIGFFSDTPNIEIRVVGFPDKGKVVPEEIERFYQDYNFTIPRLVKKSFGLPKTDSYEPSLGTNHNNILKAINDERYSKKYIEGVISTFAIKDIKERLDNPNEKLIFTWSGEGGYEIDKLVEFMEANNFSSLLSTIDYYILNTSISHSTQFNHKLTIRNDGDLDLKNVDIGILFPYSSITQSRNNTVKNIASRIYLVNHTISIGSYSANIKIPLLKKGESLQLDVYSMEQRLAESAVSSDYEAIRHIDKSKAVIIFLYVITVLALVYGVGLLYVDSPSLKGTPHC